MPRLLSFCQNSDDAPLLDQSAENFGVRHKESSAAGVADISVHLGGDVRQYPVMEEEGEEQEEEKGIATVENPEQACTPTVQGQGEEEHQTTHKDNEDEDFRRARVTREWEAIDQV